MGLRQHLKYNGGRMCRSSRIFKEVEGKGGSGGKEIYKAEVLVCERAFRKVTVN